MHVLGKVLLWFSFLLAAGATVLAVGVLGARGHWQQEIDKAQQEYAQINSELKLKRSQGKELQDEVDRVRLGWGNVWVAQNCRLVNPNTGTVSIGIGSQQGLGQREKVSNQLPLVHAFSIDGPQPQYLGAFQVTAIEGGAAEAVRMPPPAPGETIPSGTWRIREEIPYNFATRFGELHTSTLEAEAGLARMQYDIARVQEQKTSSEHLLQERVNQLMGDPSLQNASPLQTNGYVASLRDALSERDQLLQELQALRLERLTKLNALEALVESNRQKLATYQQRVGAVGALPATTAEAPGGSGN